LGLIDANRAAAQLAAYRGEERGPCLHLDVGAARRAPANNYAENPMGLTLTARW